MSGNKRQPLLPRVRFPEFHDAGEWITVELGKLSRILTERVGSATCTPYTITSGVGLISQEEKLGRTIAGNSLKNYLVLKENDFAYNKSATKAYPQGFIALYAGGERAAVPNSIFTCFRVNQSQVIPTFLDALFASNLHGKWLRTRIAVGARAHGSLQVSNDDLMATPVPLPNGTNSLEEQKKISDCLSSLDDLIAAERQKLDALKTHKKGLMQQLFPREGETVPRLRFPEFREAPAWGKEKLEKLITTVSPPSKLQSSNYGTQGKFPIIDQSQEFICGWTDDERAVITESLPLIIFGDHTCALKFVDKPFAQGADGIKILKVRPAISAEYLFHSLSHRPLAMEDYKRHFSMLKERAVVFPDIEPGEQQKIADCLSSLDDLITAQTQKIDALKTHKKGLMQQLFPTLDEVDA